MPEDKAKINSKVVMRIGNTDITKTDLINAFYTYYQNNSNYFAYYDSETIESSFYTWLTVKTMVDELSMEALYDADNNSTGYIYYTDEDAKTVWKNVEDYFYSQISTNEKALYAAAGVEEEDYPTWLQDEEDEETAKAFEAYKSPVSEIELTDRSASAVAKLTNEQVYAKIDALKDNLFKYVVSTDDEGNETKADIAGEFLPKRNQAYANYMQGLITNARANGSSTEVNDVLKAEVLRIYEAYYKSQVSVIFQNYYTQEYLLNYNDQGDKATLNDSAVVAAFLDDYYKDMQTNQVGNKYVSTMTSSDGASLVLYHYQGTAYYFSVQHILVKFSDYIDEQVKDLPYYSTSNTQSEQSASFRNQRAALVDGHSEAMLTPVNTDAQKDSIVTFGNYYYYDAEKSNVWDTTNNIYYGYVKLSDYTYDPATKTITYDFTNDNYVTSSGLEITHESNEVKLMATKDDILAAYEANYAIWLDLATQVFDGTKTVEELVELDDGKYETVEYVFEAAKNYKDNDVTDVKVLKNSVSSYVFVELEWIYSGDSLGNEVSNKIGYVVSSMSGDSGNWSIDFANGARDVLGDFDEAAYQALSDDEKAIYTKTVISEFGYHIIKVENIYNTPSIIDMASVTADYDLANNSEYVAQIIKLLKQKTICSASNETLYNYFYDKVYSNLVGTSNSSGTYFLSLEYNWLHQYYADKKIETFERIGYDELLKSIT